MSSLASSVETVEWLQPGLAGIDQAREHIQQKIADGGRHELTIQRAREIVARAPPWDEEAQVRELFDYFTSAVTGFPYRKDPVNVQHIEAAPARPRGGDCKKYTAQLGAYLEALGIPVEVVICGQHAPACGKPPRFHHVYLRARVNGRWVALDPTLHRPTFGIYAEAGDELAHAIERTYPMIGFAAANTSNTLGQFNIFDAIRSFGVFIDPTRTGSVTRGLVQSIPGVGQAAIAAADAVAEARKALTAAGTPALEPVAAASRSLQTAPQPHAEEKKEKEKKGGISAGAVVGGGLAAAGVVGGIILAAVRGGKGKKGKRGRRR